VADKNPDLLETDNGTDIIKGLRNSYYRCFFSKVNCPGGSVRLSYRDVGSVITHASVSLKSLSQREQDFRTHLLSYLKSSGQDDGK